MLSLSQAIVPATAGDADASCGSCRERKALDPKSRPMTTDATQIDFAQLYEQHFDLVWRALRRYGVPDAELQDALQEVFLTVHDRFSSFEGRSTLRTWIFGIARRIARNHRPGSLLEMTDPALLDQVSPIDAGDDPACDQLEHARILQTLLTQLTPERREIVVLVELEQLTIAEAAEILNENANTLQSRLRLARSDLASAWGRTAAQQDWRRKCATMNRG
ncbi:MAG TPA: sigma-70 family RNA polymerase sigma factor [Polyangiaceae bacterium]|nr:sigma-70 family RNA polymerase sigma factor [Polyangiaceae bacterium]